MFGWMASNIKKGAKENEGEMPPRAAAAGAQLDPEGIHSLSLAGGREGGGRDMDMNERHAWARHVLLTYYTPLTPTHTDRGIG